MSEQPSTITQFAVVTFNLVGFHNWPGAHHTREYLAARHRHRFEVRVALQVHHDEREIEYHDLLGFCREQFIARSDSDGNEISGWEFGPQSCETLARNLIRALHSAYPGRGGSVEVMEDGEVGTRAVWT